MSGEQQLAEAQARIAELEGHVAAQREEMGKRSIIGLKINVAAYAPS